VRASVRPAGPSGPAHVGNPRREEKESGVAKLSHQGQQAGGSAFFDEKNAVFRTRGTGSSPMSRPRLGVMTFRPVSRPAGRPRASAAGASRARARVRRRW
jgi:hypothetical protein